MSINFKSRLEIGVFVALLASILLTLGMLFFKLESASGIWSGPVTRRLLGYIAVFLCLIWIGKTLFNDGAKAFISILGFLFLIAYCGVAEFLSVTYFIGSAYCLGNLLLRWSFARDRILFLYSCAIGAGVLILLFSVLILFGSNTRGLYLLYLGIPIFVYCLQSKTQLARLRFAGSLIHSLNAQVNSLSSPRFYGFLFLSIYIACYCFFPTVTADEQALHLAAWTQLEANGKFVADLQSQIWAVAPNTVALIHGITSLLAGSDAKGALNLYLFLFTLSGLFAVLAKIKFDKNDSLTLATLFVSTPLIVLTLISLQTDLLLGLLFICVALSVLSLKDDKILAALGSVFCGAIALSVKLPGVLIAAPVALLALIHFFHTKSYRGLNPAAWSKLVAFLIVAMALAGWPYIKAYYYTGNPVFPLFNSIFKSEYIGNQNFKDLRWLHGANLESFIGLFFESRKHMEVTNDFVGGFQYFLLVPVAMALALLRKNGILILIALLMMVYLVPIFLSLQYLRYFYAAMPLASILIAAFFTFSTPAGIRKTLTLTSIYLVAFLNFCFMPGISWLFVISPFSVMQPAAKEALVKDMIPEVELNKLVNSLKKDAKVFMAPGRAFGATLTGHAIYNPDYSYSYYVNRKAWEHKEDVLSDFSFWEVDFVYWNQKEIYQHNNLATNLLRDALLDYGIPVLQANSLVAFKISNQLQHYHPLFKLDTETRFQITGNPVVSNSTVTLHANDNVAIDTNVSAYSAFKYQVQYLCKNDQDLFIATVAWDVGPMFYKLLQCSTTTTSFAEVGIVPPGAKKATVYLSARTNDEVIVSNLSLEGK